jgi:hypothetical protein
MSHNLLKTLESELDAAQTELIESETALLEVSARAEKAREGLSRLKAAVAALKGEKSPPPAAPVPEKGTDSKKPEETEQKAPVPVNEASEAEIDEWERERARKLRAKEKAREEEERANNPLYDIACTGCGSTGVLQQTVIQAPSGMPLNCIVCTSCGNQTFG